MVVSFDFENFSGLLMELALGFEKFLFFFEKLMLLQVVVTLQLMLFLLLFDN